MGISEERQNYRIKFGEKLKKFRLLADVKITKYPAGLSKTAIRRYEAGIREMLIYDFLNIAIEMNLSKEQFLDLIAPGLFTDK